MSSPNTFRLRRHTAATDTAKTNSKTPTDDSEDIDDDENADEEDDAEDLGSDFDKSPPVPPELSSSSLGENFRPSAVSDQPVIETDTLDRSAHKNVLSPVGNDVHENEDDEDGTESPLENEDGVLSSNISSYDYSSSPTPGLPTSALIPNSSISVTPLPAQSAADKVTSSPPKRFPPLVMHKLESVVAVAGKRYNISIPENVFHDEEDGDTTNLTLTLKSPEEKLVCPPWIEFDAERKEVIILTRIDTISNHNFIIEATDSDGMTTNASLTVAVQYPPVAQRVNFEISLHMKPVDDKNLTVTFQLAVLDRIAKLYGDANADRISVRNVTCSPFVLTWTNSSLSFDTCDNSTILNLLSVLTDTELSTNVNEKMRQELSSLVSVDKVTWQGIGLCENVIVPRLPKPPTQQNYKTVVGNVRIDNIMARVGELTVFEIPKGAFYNPDVPSGDLNINVFTIDHTSIPADNWLQYDATNRELYGLPMNGDVGSSKYQMECSDNLKEENHVARQVIDVVVEPALKVPYNIEFNLVLKMAYEDFSKSPLVRRSFMEKLAFLFEGNRNTSSIVISSYTPGSVIVTWHNKSLPVDRCQESSIEQLRKVLLDDEGKLNENVNKILGPDFEAKSGQVTPIGICEGSLTEFHSTEMNAPSQEIHAILTAKLPYYIREYFFEIILPIVIIVFMILLAGVVACILYRRQRSAKWTLGEEDERRTYRSKGIPVIFQDELEERLEPSNKNPIIMKEEKPPLPPPEYQKTLPMATTALLSDFDDPSYQQGSVTFMSQADRNGRSKATPVYRKPPPYVPP